MNTNKRTNLQKAGFIYGLLQLPEINYTTITPNEFLLLIQDNTKCSQPISISELAQKKSLFSEDELEIVKKFSKAGTHIAKKNILPNRKIMSIKWNTQDIINNSISINNTIFTFDKNDFLRQDMNTYQILNILIGKVFFKKKFCLFEQFAMEDLEEWFEHTKTLMIQELSVKPYESTDKLYRISKLGFTEGLLYFFFYGKELRIKDFASCDYKRFSKSTTELMSDKVLSGFFQTQLSNNLNFLPSAQECIKITNRKMLQFIQRHLVKDSPGHALLNVKSQPYYVVDTSQKRGELFKIVSNLELIDNLIITDIDIKNLDTTINIHISLFNKQTNQELKLRNELDYKHGLLTETPTSKMVFENGSILNIFKEYEFNL